MNGLPDFAVVFTYDDDQVVILDVMAWDDFDHDEEE